MAVRMHIVAALGDERGFVDRLGVEPARLGPWTVAIVSAWQMDASEASWHAALLSRERASLVLRASIDAGRGSDVLLFADGLPATRIDHEDGGLLPAPGEEGEPDLPWDQPLSPSQLQQIDDWDAELAVVAGSGRPLQAAATALAYLRAERVATLVTQAGGEVDSASLAQILTGGTARPQRDREDPLDAWGELPALLEATGIPGLRDHLRSREREGTDVADPPPVPPRTSSAARRGARLALACAAGLALIAIGSAIGHMATGPLGAVRGAALAGAIVVIVVTSRLWRFWQRLSGGREDEPLLPARVQVQVAPSLTLWRLLASRFGEIAPGGAYGELYPWRMPISDPAGRGLATLAASGTIGPAQRQIEQVWVAMLDAELNSASGAEASRQYQQLDQWLTGLSREAPGL